MGCWLLQGWQPQRAPTAAWRCCWVSDAWEGLRENCRAQAQRVKAEQGEKLLPSSHKFWSPGSGRGKSHKFQLSVVCSCMESASQRNCFQLGAEGRGTLEPNQRQAAAGLMGVNLTPRQCECFSCSSL